jgi:hypothetical protein
VRALGYNWDLWDDVYSAQVNARASVSVWKDKNIYQTKVFINYSVAHTRVGIFLQFKETLLSAMDSGIFYIKNSLVNKSNNVKSVIAECRTAFTTRIDTINHLFFVPGCGYEWLDGSLINTVYTEDNNSLVSFTEKSLTLQQDFDDGDLISFHPVSKYCSNICKIPDDIQPDWLDFCRESVILLRDRSGNNKSFEAVRQQENNRIIGSKIINELDIRFPKKENVFQNKFDLLKKLINNV